MINKEMVDRLIAELQQLSADYAEHEAFAAKHALVVKAKAEQAANMSDRYSPRSFTEMASDPVPISWVNQPVPPDNVTTIVRGERRSLHAVLVESLNSTQALLARLESSGGVHVPRQEQREIVRLLYVATRYQVKALTAVLELDGLE